MQSRLLSTIPAVALALTAALATCPARAQAQTPAPAASTAPPPAEAFYRRPDVVGAALSPSGRWLGVLSTIGGQRAALVVFDVLGDTKPAVVARFADLDVHQFAWVNDDRLVFNTLDHQVAVGELRWNPGLFSVARDGTDLRLRIEIDAFGTLQEHRTVRPPLSAYHRLLHVPNDGSDDVIVGEDLYDASGQPMGVRPKRLNVANGTSRLVVTDAPSNVFQWWFDARGEPRMVVTREKDRQRLYWRAPADARWELLRDSEIYDLSFSAHSIDADGNLYVTQPRGPAGTTVLARYDFKTREPAAQALVSTPGFDFRGSIVTETPGSRALGVRVETDAETTAWFEPRLKALQDEADKRLPGRVNRLNCKRCDDPAGMVVLVTSYSDRDPGEYLIYRSDRKEWRSIVQVRSAIDPRRMGLRDFYRIKARDGLEIPVWVTTPPGPPPKAPRPTVVLVHGGPWVRGGTWGWTADAQFLASRGYVVIEPEFRGSTGYGQALFSAGLRQWGLSMQDDVADALLWAVGKGLADGKRACIMGASYGGYATLMGLVRQPELYRCGVAMVAVTDPRLMFQWTADSDQPDIVRQYDYKTLIGDPVADAARLADAAPVTHAAKIKAPVMLVAAGRDRRVPLEHMTRMRDALTAAGNPPQWVIYDLEAHGWLRAETHIDFATRLERFLSEQLK